MRDNLSLTRQAYVEFDLQGMMSGEIYSDFILLFMLLHQSRLEAERPEQCWLERWVKDAQRQGTRALDQLRVGVEQAIATLGQGFLTHPANSSTRQKLQSGDLTTDDYYQQLLRLVYRMIFLFVAEDRNLLLPSDAPPETRRLYIEHYSIARIRRMAGRLRGTRHNDIWQALRVTFAGLENGQPDLALDPLGGFLFSQEGISDLTDSEISNEALLTAVRQLSYTRDNKILRPIDYRNLGTEELGSVYESLLELHPEVSLTASTFELKVAAGSERKTTGSYYTPSSLINCLLDSALEPVIDGALTKPDPEKALLNLKIVDPACGSGHFLIAAAHRIGKHLAMVRTGEAEPAPEERRRALRDVVAHCIYGVDMNPLAVELCKVALWIETLDPGKPLGFLDHHIKCGNSLLGATPELLEKGISDDAFKAVEGDDPKIAGAIRKKNKEERKGQQNLFTAAPKAIDWEEAVQGFQSWGHMPENSYLQVCEKAAEYETLCEKPSFRHEKEIADLWTAAFFWPLTKEAATTVPTQDVYIRFQANGSQLKQETRKRMEELSFTHRFFHWHLEFPEVFTNNPNQNSHPPKGGTHHNISPLSPSTFPPLAGGTEGGGSGGFDCVLGNPPWERIKLQEKEFFAQRDPEIANAPNAAARKKLIADLPESNPGLWDDFQEAKRSSESESHFIRASDRYPLSAVGDINTYQIFAGLARELISTQGRAGIVIPSGIATDDSNKQFFSDLTEKRCLVSLYDFENREGIFPGVHRSYKFCLLTIGGANAVPKGADYAFFLTNVGQMREEDRHFSLSTEDIALLNPNTRTCPIFRTKRDAEITKAIYRRVPVLIDENKGEDGNPWGMSFLRMLDMANDSHLFRTRDELEAEGWKLEGNVFKKNGERYVPLYEAKMAGFYDHRAADVVISATAMVRQGQPASLSTDDHQNSGRLVFGRYWVSEKDVETALPNVWEKLYLLGFTDVTSPTNERTTIATLIPLVGVGHTMPLIFPQHETRMAVLLLAANLNSFMFDYIGRQKLGGIHYTYFILKQLPVITPKQYDVHNRRSLIERVLELTYTAYDMKPFAEDVWAELYRDTSEQPSLPEPYLWDEQRRFLMRSELDAIYFHLYGIDRDNVDYIMETFPIVKRKDEQKYGEYRTKRVILECYDAMAEAKKTGRPYQTILDPPPADPRCCHPPKEVETP
ncbi:MAG: N-6 DNA methylase [bacterium]